MTERSVWIDSSMILKATFEKIIESINIGIFDLLHTGVALFCDKGFFIYCNKSFLKMYNLPESVIGKHITDYFLTGERGVMSSIRTRKMVICSSQTKNNVWGVSFRYPIQDEQGQLRGVVVESIPSNLDKDKLLALLDTVRNLEMKSYSFSEQKEAHKNSGLYTFEAIVGEAPCIENMRCLGRRFAFSQEPILVCGESGTGKELVAQALHMASQRSDRPFVTVNCAALPPELMESELFGYETGAFTGAKVGGVKGKFEMADTGTIFLDEIGELPLPMQAKLLRVLETGEIQKIAHKGQLHSDFRLIGATNRNLAEMVRQGQFREDLYHRLSVFELDIPPLRDRVSDIPLLVRHFVTQSVGDNRQKDIRIDDALYDAFAQYPWRGNVRELKNVLVYALYSLGDDQSVLTVQHLPPRFMRELEAAVVAGTIPDAEDSRQDSQNFSEASARAERKVLWDALVNSRYNKVLAARTLGISRSKLYRKLREPMACSPSLRRNRGEPPHGNFNAGSRSCWQAVASPTGGVRAAGYTGGFRLSAGRC